LKLLYPIVRLCEERLIAELMQFVGKRGKACSNGWTSNHNARYSLSEVERKATGVTHSFECKEVLIKLNRRLEQA